MSLLNDPLRLKATLGTYNFQYIALQEVSEIMFLYACINSSHDYLKK